MNRAHDWLQQAERDLAHAEHAVDDADYEWAAFAAQQAAEKAVKAVIYATGGEPWGHSIVALMEAMRDPVSDGLMEAAQRLDKHYFATRYPNGLPAGYPGKLYIRGEAEDAIADAGAVVAECRSRLSGPGA